MGSPVSAFFADMVMEEIEQQCLSKLNFTPVVYTRYVDDVIASIPYCEVNNILQVFNNQHGRIKFTHETETNDSINFLDMKLIRDENTIRTNWTQKATFFARILHYKSTHPIHQKIAMVFYWMKKLSNFRTVSFINKILNLYGTFYT